MELQARKSAVAWLSVVSNSVLVVFKIFVGLLIGSVSVISEAIHSGVDLMASCIALVAVKHSAKPADERHPFGHGKVENISGTIEAVLIFGAAIWIIYEAVGKFVHPRGIDQPAWGVGVMLISAAANLVISRKLFKVGKETDSVALQADSWHLRTDVYTSLGVMAGLAAIWLGDRFAPHLGDTLHLIDPIAAIAVAMLIMKAAWELTAKSARDLMDVQLPPEEQAWIRDMLMEFRPAVHGFHRMRTRKAGAERFVEFHIFVNAKMTVEDSHRIAHQIVGKIKDHFGPASVTVHVEPCSGRCEECHRAGCLLNEEQRAAVRKEQAAGGRGA